MYSLRPVTSICERSFTCNKKGVDNQPEYKIFCESIFVLKNTVKPNTFYCALGRSAIL